MQKKEKHPNALKQGTELKNGIYITGEVLGAGGFGITYLGTKKADTAFGDDQKVVIKELFLSVSDYNCTRDHVNNQTVIPQNKLTDSFGQFQERFKNEALTLHKFRHLDGMVKVLDYFEENGTNYFTMEYIKAETLKDYVLQKGGLPVAEALGYIGQIGKLLTELHAKNVMHRDIKPENILINGQKKVYLIDFGIAKEYDETGIVTKITGMGTNRYAPPEQLAGIKDLISFAMDVFGLASTLYYFLTATDPQTSDEENIYGKKTVLDFCPDIPAKLNDAIEKGRIKRPKDRIQSVEGFLGEINKAGFIDEVGNCNTNEFGEQTIIGQNPYPSHNNILTDNDGNIYKTIKIGSQTWMAENLNLDVGDGCWCYDNKQSNCDKYGRLYTWEAAKRAADKIPGWHLPTDEEWKQLEMHLGMSKRNANHTGWRGNGNIGKKLKSTSGWRSGDNGNNSSGFSALPGGYRYNFCDFNDMGRHADLWTATAYNSSNAWERRLYYNNSKMARYYNSKGCGYSVRLVRD